MSGGCRGRFDQGNGAVSTSAFGRQGRTCVLELGFERLQARFELFEFATTRRTDGFIGGLYPKRGQFLSQESASGLRLPEPGLEGLPIGRALGSGIFDLGLQRRDLLPVAGQGRRASLRVRVCSAAFFLQVSPLPVEPLFFALERAQGDFGIPGEGQHIPKQPGAPLKDVAKRLHALPQGRPGVAGQFSGWSGGRKRNVYGIAAAGDRGGS